MRNAIGVAQHQYAHALPDAVQIVYHRVHRLAQTRAIAVTAVGAHARGLIEHHQNHVRLTAVHAPNKPAGQRTAERHNQRQHNQYAKHQHQPLADLCVLGAFAVGHSQKHHRRPRQLAVPEAVEEVNQDRQRAQRQPP